MVRAETTQNAMMPPRATRSVRLAGIESAWPCRNLRVSSNRRQRNTRARSLVKISGATYRGSRRLVRRKALAAYHARHRNHDQPNRDRRNLVSRNHAKRRQANRHRVNPVVVSPLLVAPVLAAAQIGRPPRVRTRARRAVE